MGIGHFSGRASLGLALLLATPVFAEHEYPLEAAPAEEPSLRKSTSTDGLVAPSVFAKPAPPANSSLNSLAILRIQETVSRTDPQTLQALKQALSDISEGKKVDGQAGAIALELLSRIPDSDVASPTVPKDVPVTAEPSAYPAGKLAETTSPSPDRFKEFAADGSKRESAPTRLSAGGAVSVPPGAVVRLEVPSASTFGVSRAVASVSNPSFGEVFPYGTSAEAKANEEESKGEAPGERANGKRPSKGPPAAGPGGDSLPTGEGLVSGGGTFGGGTGGGNLGTFVMNSGAGAAKNGGSATVGEGKQRLAGVVSSFLGRFQGRAVASLADGESRPGIFGKLANRSGMTTELAMSKAASSPVYREFQRATTEAGFTPRESLGAYYSVLAMAWLCTFGLVAYVMRNLPTIRLAWAERKKKKA